MNSNLAYREERREELIGGQVVAMSPRPSVDHNRVASNIFYLFHSYLKGRKCEPFADGTDLYLTEDDAYVPDFMVVCDPDKVKMDGVHGAPDLVAEVLSPGTARYDRGRKKDVYESCGVGEYWIVSPSDKLVEQYLLKDGRYELHMVYVLHPDWVLKKLSEKELAEVVTRFQCSLYDDLTIDLEDVFYRTT